MIKDKELDLKVAENPEEVFWERTREKLEKEIEEMKHVITMDEYLLRLCERKLKGGKSND